ncbi:MAG: 6-phosphofructokinase [Rickettsiales bacterium]|jgi:6-phosphofructokinase 1|nr:6-phosphofructokinase [Rickettsiales bacterium]
MSKKIGIMTTGGDCSGLNNVIFRLVQSGLGRGHEMFGILDGTDGLSRELRVKSSEFRVMSISANSELNKNIIRFAYDTLPAAYSRLSGSILRNGHPNALNYRTTKGDEFQKQVKKSIEKLKLDAIVLLGGNGSISIAHSNPHVYASTQLVCIPKTIDMDIPLTETTIGFQTAVSELVKYADQLLLTARSHHRWFVVQTMGRDSGFLCLHAGLAAGASAILIPEAKWKLPDLISHIKKQSTDYGLIFVAEGCHIRGRSGAVADIIVRDLTAAGISARAEFPEHLQRSGDTSAPDRILAAEFAASALAAVENNETFVMTARQNGTVKTIPLNDVINAGVIIADPNIPKMFVSNEYVSADDPLVKTVAALGIFI